MLLVTKEEEEQISSLKTSARRISHDQRVATRRTLLQELMQGQNAECTTLKGLAAALAKNSIDDVSVRTVSYDLRALGLLTMGMRRRETKPDRLRAAAAKGLKMLRQSSLDTDFLV